MTPLPTIASRPPDRRPARPIRQADHACRLVAAGIDAEQPSALQLRQRRLVEHVHLESARGGDLDGDLGHAARGEVSRWRVGEVAGELCGTRHDPPPLGPGGHALRPRRADDERHLLEVGARRLLLERAVPVARQQQPLHHRSTRDVGANAVDVRQRGHHTGVLAGRPAERGSRVAQRSRIQLGRVTDANSDHGRTATARQAQRLADLALEAGCRQRRPVETELARNGAVLADGVADDVTGRRDRPRDRDAHRARALDRGRRIERGGRRHGGESAAPRREWRRARNRPRTGGLRARIVARGVRAARRGRLIGRRRPRAPGDHRLSPRTRRGQCGSVGTSASRVPRCRRPRPCRPLRVLAGLHAPPTRGDGPCRGLAGARRASGRGCGTGLRVTRLSARRATSWRRSRVAR